MSQVLCYILRMKKEEKESRGGGGRGRKRGKIDLCLHLVYGENPLAIQETQETQFWSLGQEDSLKKEIASHSGILNWKTPWTEEPGGLQFKGSQRVRYD